MASAFTTVAVGYGHGRHVQTLSQHQAEHVRLWTFAAFMPGVLVLGLPKVAVVTLLNRLLNPSKWQRRFLWIMVSWCVLSNVATIGVLAGQCTPTRAQWNFDMAIECINPDYTIGFSLYSGGEFDSAPKPRMVLGPHADSCDYSIQRFRGPIPGSLPSHCALQASAQAQEEARAERRIGNRCCVSCFIVHFPQGPAY